MFLESGTWEKSLNHLANTSRTNTTVLSTLRVLTSLRIRDLG